MGLSQGAREKLEAALAARPWDAIAANNAAVAALYAGDLGGAVRTLVRCGRESCHCNNFGRQSKQIRSRSPRLPTQERALRAEPLAVATETVVQNLCGLCVTCTKHAWHPVLTKYGCAVTPSCILFTTARCSSVVADTSWRVRTPRTRSGGLRHGWGALFLTTSTGLRRRERDSAASRSVPVESAARCGRVGVPAALLLSRDGGGRRHPSARGAAQVGRTTHLPPQEKKEPRTPCLACWARQQRLRTMS